jgi:hypothetical protein
MNQAFYAHMNNKRKMKKNKIKKIKSRFPSWGNLRVGKKKKSPKEREWTGS